MCFAGSNIDALDVGSARPGAHAILPYSVAFIAANAFDPQVKMKFGHYSALMQAVASQLVQAEQRERELSAANEAIRSEVGVLQRENDGLREELERLRIAHRRVVRGLEDVLDECPAPG
jgi:hypothetical protein